MASRDRWLFERLEAQTNQYRPAGLIEAVLKVKLSGENEIVIQY